MKKEYTYIQGSVGRGPRPMKIDHPFVFLHLAQTLQTLGIHEISPWLGEVQSPSSSKIQPSREQFVDPYPTTKPEVQKIHGRKWVTFHGDMLVQRRHINSIKLKNTPSICSYHPTICMYIYTYMYIQWYPTHLHHSTRFLFTRIFFAVFSVLSKKRWHARVVLSSDRPSTQWFPLGPR